MQPAGSRRPCDAAADAAGEEDVVDADYEEVDDDEKKSA